VPRVVVEALRRGLSAEPDERWPSMDELLEALSWDPRRRRHRWVSGLAGGLALGLGGMALWGWADDRPQQCTGAAARIGEVWSDARRADVEAAIVGTGKSYAVGVWDRVEPQLEQYADGWAQMYTEACEATTVRAEQSDRMMDLRMACLDRALVDLGAAVETLSGADAELVRKAHEVTAGMRPLSWCADTEALDAELDPPRPQEAEAVKEARQQLARAESLLRGGRYADAQSVLELAEAELAGVEYGPARMELALTKGRVLGALGDYDASEVALTEALRLASQWQERRPLADALRAMMTVVGRYQQRTDDALRYWPLLEGVSLYDPMEHAEAREIRATILRSKGELEEAEAEHRAVLSMREEVLGADHPDVASTRNSLANVLNAQGKYEEAVAEHRRALAVAHRALGPDHPTVARYRNSLANALWKLGELEEAESEHRAALASKLEALGPNHPSVTTSRQNLASILITRGKLDEAELEARAALRSGEESRGAAHPETARARSNLAVLLIKQGKLEEAEAETRAALAAQQQARGPDHEDVAAVQANLAAILLDQGKLEEGEAEARAAIAVMERVLGADHPSLFYPRTLVANALESGGKLDEAEAEYRGVLALLEGSVGSEHPDMARARASLAKLLVLRQRAADALPLAEQAWAQYQRDDAVPEDRAETAFVLARALWEVDGPLRDRARARQLADDALESFREAGRAFDGFAREVQQWLDDHQRP
ncbi:MAG: tetratricopeptide repeat protein, partial [Nannocystaceae bacterium]